MGTKLKRGITLAKPLSIASGSLLETICLHRNFQWFLISPLHIWNNSKIHKGNIPSHQLFFNAMTWGIWQHDHLSLRWPLAMAIPPVYQICNGLWQQAINIYWTDISKVQKCVWLGINEFVNFHFSQDPFFSVIGSFLHIATSVSESFFLTKSSHEN